MTGNQTAEQIASRWIRAQRALKAGDQVYAGRLSSVIRTCPAGRYAGIQDPLEASLYALLIEVVQDLDARGSPDRADQSCQENGVPEG